MKVTNLRIKNKNRPENETIIIIIFKTIFDLVEHLCHFFVCCNCKILLYDFELFLHLFHLLAIGSFSPIPIVIILEEVIPFETK